MSCTCNNLFITYSQLDIIRHLAFLSTGTTATRFNAVQYLTQHDKAHNVLILALRSQSVIQQVSHLGSQSTKLSFKRQENENICHSAPCWITDMTFTVHKSEREWDEMMKDNGVNLKKLISFYHIIKVTRFNSNTLLCSLMQTMPPPFLFSQVFCSKHLIVTRVILTQSKLILPYFSTLDFLYLLYYCDI